MTFTLSQRAHAARVVEIVAPVVPALARALQPRTEVVLHDLTRMPNTIVAISGDVTGREIGGPPTDLGLLTFRLDNPEDMVNYRTETADGLVLRSASMFFRTPAGKPVACLCINSDIHELERAKEVLDSLTAFHDPQSARSAGAPRETFPSTVDDLADGIIRQAIDAVGVPVHLMKKSHKLEVVRDLDRRGFFAIREAVDVIAERLGVSRYTIYNYLNQISGDQGSGKSASAG
ncbi:MULTISPECIES: helix-turn-helix transcriptional regulator [unclassified Streptomyces]|uniref:helix-turn-helix transcriptional regulator n=1 Tax=unclassified Streptomyces TaxID=2593676 RepID=UPI002E3350B9|nr:PAS domain-containing protein [Streptomyces sp. NBC_01361]